MSKGTKHIRAGRVSRSLDSILVAVRFLEKNQEAGFREGAEFVIKSLKEELELDADN